MPDSPFQGGAGWEVAGGSAPVVAGERSCAPCPKAIPHVAAASPTAITIGRALCIPFPSSLSIPNLWVTRYHFSGVNGLILFDSYLDLGRGPCFLGLYAFTIRIARKDPMTRIRKAIFPVAGLGTRFLPATKAMPKEMLPVVDRPLIQHVVDEARQAGIEHFIFVTGRNKSVIEDHFDRLFELELTLMERGKKTELALLSEDLPAAGTVSFTRQQSPLGLGHAVWCARELVGHEPFALLLPDVLVQHSRGCLAQMIDAAKGLDSNANILAVEKVPKERVHMYGVVGVGERKGKAFAITKMVEKPKASEAPSDLTITGRYILQPQIFELLEKQAAGAGGEIQLTDAMLALSGSQPFYGLEFEGRSFDCGSKIGFLAANVAYGLERPDIAPELRTELRRLLGEK